LLTFQTKNLTGSLPLVQSSCECPDDGVEIVLIVLFSSCVSIWSIGANDVANSYGTSVASGSLTLLQAGILQTFTEFIGNGAHDLLVPWAIIRVLTNV